MTSGAEGIALVLVKIPDPALEDNGDTNSRKKQDKIIIARGRYDRREMIRER